MPSSLHITLLIDASGSMTAEGGIASTDDFRRRLVQGLSGASQADDPGVTIRSLAYSNEPKWLENAPIEVGSVHHPPISVEGPFSNFGKALDFALAAHPGESETGRVAWIWLGDGYVTDDWMTQVERLRTDPAYHEIERYAIYPEGQVDLAALRWFAGKTDHVNSATHADSILNQLKTSASSRTTDEWDDEIF